MGPLSGISLKTGEYGLYVELHYAIKPENSFTEKAVGLQRTLLIDAIVPTREKEEYYSKAAHRAVISILCRGEMAHRIGGT